MAGCAGWPGSRPRRRGSTLPLMGRLQAIDLPSRSLGAYAAASDGGPIERIGDLAGPLAGARILHLSVAGRGGRVPELLQALLPLARDAGLEVEWRVLFGGPELHTVARALHDGLQGAESHLDDAAWTSYLEACGAATESLAGSYDAIVLHDPDALGAAAAMDEGMVIWRCHLDASEPDPASWGRARPLAEGCGALVFPAESFAPPDLSRKRMHAVPPGIDPLSPRNLDLAPRLAGRIVRLLGVDLTRPFCCQLMRFDRWKDPHATIEAFAQAKAELSELQLVLAGVLESSEGEAWSVVKEVGDYAAGEEDIHLLTSYGGLGNLELGALQRLARLALQKSIREGFGLAAAEALWKRTPVVGSPSGGVPLQVREGVEGYLCETAEQTAGRIVELVRDPGLAIEMGAAGHERVRERFLVTRVLEDELRLLQAVGAERPATVKSP
jgi:trehalose synthase